MRIDPTPESSGVGPASPAHLEAAPSPPPARTDQVELSVLSRAAAGVTPARIQEIQSSVRSGAYQVNATQVSRNIVDFYLIPVE